MQINIVEIGVCMEIKLIINGIRFYTHEQFETEEEARIFLQEHGLKSK